jgi:hypothetical protein
VYLEAILNRFDNVKKVGSEQYSCRCPSHNDKNNSLGIKQDGDKILFNCFAGCNVKSILDTVGLKWKDIMPNDNEMDMQIKKTFNPYAVLKMLRDEVLLVGLCSASIRKGKPLNDVDHNRLMLAVSNIRDAYEKCR